MPVKIMPGSGLSGSGVAADKAEPEG